MKRTPFQGQQIALLGASNGRVLTRTQPDPIEDLTVWLRKQGAVVRLYPSIWRNPKTGRHLPAAERARFLQQALQDPNLDWILDPTGGDLANETLAQLPSDFFQTLKRSRPIRYMGYSDNTVILNACLVHPMIEPINFFPLALVQDQASCQAFCNWLAHSDTASPSLERIGGNLRCLMKLLGTPFWPQAIEGKELLLEASSGSLERIQSLLTQLKQTLPLEALARIRLGQFNEVDRQGHRTLLVDYLSQLTSVPLVSDQGLGHHFPLQPYIYHRIDDDNQKRTNSCT